MLSRDWRFKKLLFSMCWRGESRVSGERENRVRDGGIGDPLDFLDKNPALNRLSFPKTSAVGCGGVGSGDDSREEPPLVRRGIADGNDNKGE